MFKFLRVMVVLGVRLPHSDLFRSKRTSNRDDMFSGLPEHDLGSPLNPSAIAFWTGLKHEVEIAPKIVEGLLVKPRQVKAHTRHTFQATSRLNNVAVQ